ncbi:uncharacterized protein LOC130904008 [Diorhabda carinulata]|uniref:uncharacterized protein LOC130904008 n=1 Tax=Diorhabda carinulata TaxID=1163345 RepID=UPI0025A00027|nr:uncharacterized protein LOC130904008 [Diorhabda carinulata]
MNISLTVTAILFIILYFENVACDEVEKKEDDKYSAPVWFGPRIGRKKRGLFEEGYKNLDKEELEALLEFIRKSPWTIMLFNNGRGHLLNFSPKETKLNNLNEDEITEMVQRSMFAPRLGRSTFYSKLGRDNEME